MNKEEIEELKDFTIDLTDIDELALGLEVCSKKSNMVIQEFADIIIQLQHENQELKSILVELEEWLKDVDIFQMNFIENKNHITPFKAVLDKIQELKED